MISLTTAIIALIALSLVLDAVVNWLKSETNDHHPLTSILVVIGVTYTILAALLVDYGKYTQGQDWFVSWQTLFECFVASGVPMIGGDWLRWLRGQK